MKFTASVTSAGATSSGAATPTGQVQFYVDGNKMESPRTLTNGVATTAYNKFVENGDYEITATYLGDSQFNGSDSASTTQKVTTVTSTAQNVYLPLITR